MRTLIFALLLIFPNLALWADETDSIAADTVATRPLPGYFIDSDHDGIDDRQNEIDKRIADSLLRRDKDYWKKMLLKGKLDLKDETIVYPKFVKFCVDVYKRQRRCRRGQSR